jgi:hypothetical protein
MRTRAEILDFKKFVVDDFQKERRRRQLLWQEFYDDVFKVPMIQEPQYLCRTGTGAWLIDGPTAHIVTRNPQAFVYPKKISQQANDAANRVNTLYTHWLKLLLKQSPQPFKEHVKNLILRGEAWIHPMVNVGWEKGKDTLPVIFSVPDPLNIYASPIEDAYGVPEAVCVVYNITPWYMRQQFPEWKNPKSAGEGKDKPQLVEMFQYIDKDVRFWSGDGEAVLNGDEGVQENILHFVPYIHDYSGFGKDSPEGKPESLVVGRIAKVMDLLIQECAINSDIDSWIHKFVHPNKTLLVPDNYDGNTKELAQELNFAAASINIVPVPVGSKFTDDAQIPLPPELTQHYLNIRARIQMEAPPIMSGLPSGASGRQEDIVGSNFIRRFDSVMEATEDAFGKALDMGRRILQTIPTYLPVNTYLETPEGQKEVVIKKDDFDLVTDASVVLKSKDPIEDDRKLQAHLQMYERGLVNWETVLVEGYGKTPDEAKVIMQKTLAEKVLMTNPAILMAVGQEALQQLGMDARLKLLQEELAKGGTAASPSPPSAPGGIGSQGGPPRKGNIQTPTGMEMADISTSQNGIRRAPTPTGAGLGG